MAEESAKWEELDSDEIASINSDDLYNARPNRWTGAKSTWRHFTEDERRLWLSMKQLEDQDLAVHLYNAFALKKQAKDPRQAQDLTVRTDNGEETVWAPPKPWTAWPLRENDLPDADLIKRQHDDDEGFTFRKPEVQLPSSALQDELNATILRLAKDRFAKRMKTSIQPSVEVESSESDKDGDDIVIPESPTGGNTGNVSSRCGSATASGEDEADGGRAAGKTQLHAVVAADDEQSHRLLRAPVRHMLSQLDSTLTILHNARVAGLSYLSDSSTEDESDGQASQKRRPRGRPRKQSLRDLEKKPAKMTRRGRPKKVHIPLPGETEEEMQLRVARQSHRRLPLVSRPDAEFEEWAFGTKSPSREQSQPDYERQSGGVKMENDGAETNIMEVPSHPLPESKSRRKETEDRLSDFESDGQSPTTPRVHRNRSRASETEEQELQARSLDKNARRSSTSPPRPRSEQDEIEDEEWALTNVDKKLARWGIRDWSDVVGAAALAGFSGDVIARTTKRCADLFGQEMTIRRLDEVPASQGVGFHSITYRPEKIRLADSDDAGDDADDESNEDRAISRRRLALRQASLARSSRQSSNSEIAALPTSRGRRSGSGRSVANTPSRIMSSPAPPESRSRSRSGSRSSAGGGLFFCPVASCDRAVKGFARRPNLKRHVELVHQGYDAELAAAAAAAVSAGGPPGGGEDVDSDDEVVGAVHVDGFLKPIVPGKGWRGEDTMTRKRKRFYGDRE